MPPDDAIEISTAAQYKALGHPLRHRLLFALGLQTATISQLAIALSQRKGNIAHHLGVLEAAGMVRIVETRQVRGGTEHYYQRVARRWNFAGADAHGPVMVRAVADELATAAPDPLLHIRNVRLTEAQAEKLSATLDQLLTEVEPADEPADRYGILVTLYKPQQ